ncbi:MAG: SpoIID/LytB domain-containing protein, partial [Clostridia bacterium]|nr:SpoIID/LytB domain-containing protein [Clostridia bacterium]
DEYEKKTEAAVDAVFGNYLTYNGETALAVYHSNSAGKTQSAETLWGSEIPYLISVESPGDKLSPDYMSVQTFAAAEFKKLAKSCDITLGGDEEEWVAEITKADSGYVMSVRLGATEVSASKFREEFGLKSCCFEIDYSDGEFTVTCYGYGHGAGMSQYGADYMARQGSTWREILAHYYPGTEVNNDE